ncbi:heme o synthase [Pseudomonas neustonica]|uniref:Protoheme IX farnesyltransferase n=1 Tax=Pseudomonas neustonica TaxID=2487346 RepID=A0ABX9XIS5_9PSED|nr:MULTISPECIES: heme o synthase [Pseudomonas]MAB25580.1 protoheme IX farnesyltransferase [Pseudomonadales bacterium]MAB25972.1 protoheme IX farnesyltransferase [Pseudomonadales bacterium]MBA6419890.1 protoheme IX farnesyltransferase [Pseudomonas sp. 5Ae-yellow]ROZ83262.1 protoheme IX farnesyltransferase [Pseudomonas sp. SSM44]ROZ85209.1 protoheme IX farnesyltransferase [Pseudomonas neustonica]
MKLKRYLLITKPGIIFGNLIAVAGGYFLAAQGQIDLTLLLATVVGLSLVVASGCVMNNCIDRDIDGHMQRTRERVLVTGQISLLAAMTHGLVLGVAGFGLLWWFTTPIATLLAAFGYIIYVGFYSLWLKRTSVYGTLVGSLSGAMPPVVGYCAVTGQFDTGAALLLLIFCLWQMPHSYAIAIFRFDDYSAAGIPVLPVKEGIKVAKQHIVWYIVAFAGAALMLSLSGFAGYGYLVIALLVSIWWLVIALSGYKQEVDDKVWARKLFGFSIIAITALSLMMSIDFRVLPTQALFAAL